MRNMKRLTSLLLALVMVFSLAVTAFAEEADTYSITINNSAPDHVYEAYQIFVGDLAKNADNDAAAGTNAVLSNIQWGSSVANKDELGSAEVYAEALNAGTKSLEALLKDVELGAPAGNSGNTCNPYVIDGLEAGYYLIKDQDDSLNGKDDSYTEFVLEVLENSTISPKSSGPRVQKKVKDINDSTETEMSEWQDSADHDIGDHVPFQLKATLASNVESYLKYMVIFHDTLSKGMTYDPDSYRVYLGEGEDRTDVTSYFSIDLGEYSATTGTQITFTCSNVKAFGATNNSVIAVEYTATLNQNANLGAPGNPNVVYLEYSNNPNWGWDIWTDENGNDKWDEGETPDKPDDEADDEDTGKTPQDKVIVFTYKLDVNKVTKDAQGNSTALEGATFTLEKKQADNTWEAIELSVEANVFSAVGLDDGIYRLTETVAPAGYNQLTAPIYFKVEATHDELADEPALLTLTVSLIDEKGEVIADVQSGNVGSFTADKTTGFIATDVVNKAGVVLPETGGMGTTVFYVLGAVMVLGAAVLLVTKRRMAA